MLKQKSIVKISIHWKEIEASSRFETFGKSRDQLFCENKSQDTVNNPKVRFVLQWFSLWILLLCEN